MSRVVLLLAAFAALAQAEANVITISASRQFAVQPDQISLTVEVATDNSRTLDDVVAFLKGTNISANDFSSVRSPVTDFVQADSINPELLWTFTPTVSFSDLSGELAALAALPSTGPTNLSYFSLSATASPQAIAAQPCPYPALINDARTQAAKLAAAAGGAVGPIVSIEQPAATQSAPYVYDFMGSFRLGPPTIVELVGSLSFLLSNDAAASSCSLAVQFQLVH